MDYEKAYNEALERAKEFHKSKEGIYVLAAETIFPELRESEDERIRAVILKLVLGMRDEIFTTADKLVTKPKVLAWLEKQKEQKPAEWSEEDRDRVAQYLHDRDGGMLWSKATEITSDILDILRPRPSWKPSEHQMTILKAVKNYVGVGSGYWGEALGSLIEDLEKLM